MPRVPTYDGLQVQQRPSDRQGIDLRYSPSAFGADAAQGMMGLARGGEAAADSLMRLRDVTDTMAAKDALTAMEREKLDLEYGEAGYLTTAGANAANGYQGHIKAVEGLKAKYGATLKGGAARKFADAADGVVTTAMRSGLVHSAQGTKEWAATSSEARLSLFGDQALSAWDKPDEVNRSIAAGFAEINAQGQLAGWGSDVLDLKKKVFASTVHTNVAMAMAGRPNGVTGALEYIKKNSDLIDAKTRIDIETKLKPFADEEAALSVVDEIVRGTRAAAPEYRASKGVKDGVTIAGRSGSPTAAKAFLSSKSSHKDRPMDTLGLDDAFAENLSALIQDAPPGIREGLGLLSAYRTKEQQSAAFASARPGMAAKPGGSQHEVGRAVDLSYNGRSLAHAPKEVVDWVHANANQYGLYFPLINSQRAAFGMAPIDAGKQENWHVEPIGSRGSKVIPAYDGVSARASMPSYDDAMAKIMAIEDPGVRDAAMKKLGAHFEMRAKAQTAQKNEAVNGIWSTLVGGGSMTDIPLEVKIAAGREAVEAFDTFERKQNEIVTDPGALGYFTLLAATEPEEFKKIDFLAPDVMAVFGKADLQGMIEKQATLLGADREMQDKIARDGVDIKAAMDMANTPLEALGITQTGAKDQAARQEAARRKAEFQMGLLREMEYWQAVNPTKRPQQADILQMVNKLLLPTVLEGTGGLLSSDDVVPYFESGGLGYQGNGVTARLQAVYDNIPYAMRVDIENGLELFNGRKPSEAEVEAKYREYLQDGYGVYERVQMRNTELTAPGVEDLSALAGLGFSDPAIGGASPGALAVPGLDPAAGAVSDPFESQMPSLMDLVVQDETAQAAAAPVPAADGALQSSPLLAMPDASSMLPETAVETAPPAAMPAAPVNDQAVDRADLADRPDALSLIGDIRSQLGEDSPAVQMLDSLNVVASEVPRKQLVIAIASAIRELESGVATEGQDALIGRLLDYLYKGELK